MGNERLREALRRAQKTLDDVVQLTGVDPKTVQRWLNGRVPHTRHRWAIAQLLHMRETDLWDLPETSPLPQSQEVIASYAHRSQAPTEEWWRLFVQAEEHIDLLAYAMLFVPEQYAGLMSFLREKSASGCKIRIAMADPTCEMVQIRDKEEGLDGTLPGRIKNSLYHFQDIFNCPGIEICYHSTPLYNSLFRFDDEMFVTPHLYSLHGSKAPLLHIRRMKKDGVFDNFVAHFEAVWATTVPIGTWNEKVHESA